METFLLFLRHPNAETFSALFRWVVHALPQHIKLYRYRPFLFKATKMRAAIQVRFVFSSS
jgi:hypothetical protein